MLPLYLEPGFRCSKETKRVLFPVIIPTEDGEIELEVEVNGPVGNFYYRMDGKTLWQEIGEPQELLFLAEGFTGNFAGIGVHDMDRKAGSYADFDFFEYCGLDTLQQDDRKGKQERQKTTKIVS